MAFLSKSNTQLSIDEQGRLGIGTSAPEQKLHVIGSSLLFDSKPGVYFRDKDDATDNSIIMNAGNLYLGGSNTGRNVIFRSQDAFTESGRFDSAGRLGINRVAISDYLEVGGNISSYSGLVRAMVDASSQARLNSNGSLELVGSNTLVAFKTSEAAYPTFTLQANNGILNLLSGQNTVFQIKTASTTVYASKLQAGLSGDRGVLLDTGNISLWSDTLFSSIEFKNTQLGHWHCRLRKDASGNLEVWAGADTLVAEFEKERLVVHKNLVVEGTSSFTGLLTTQNLKVNGVSNFTGDLTAAVVNGTYAVFSNDITCRKVMATGLAELYNGVSTNSVEVVGLSATSRGLGVEVASNTFEDTIVNLSTWRTGYEAFSFLRTVSDSDGVEDIEHDLSGDGNGYADGSWVGGGADYADYFEWEDGNPNGEDRKGITVIAVEDKIREAKEFEEPIGVVSRLAVIVGNSGWNKWRGKFLRDAYGTYLTENVTYIEWIENKETYSYKLGSIPDDIKVPDSAIKRTQEERVLNPEYDTSTEYVPRSERHEWDPIGIVGRVRIKKGQVTGVNWIKLRDISEEVEEWLIK